MALWLLGHVRKQNTSLVGARGVGDIGLNHALIRVVLVTFLFYFKHQRISQRAVRTSIEQQLDPTGPIASRRGYRTYQNF